MIRFLVLLFLLLPHKSLCESILRFSIDLTTISSDKLDVVLETPTFQSDTVIYSFPRMVPGTYKVYDFGRFVENFKAFDKNGVELGFEHLNDCDWKISNAKKLSKISYQVNDTWDADSTNFIFEPAGTNFQKDSNYVLNNHIIYGYFKNLQAMSYDISIKKPVGFYGATSLKTSETNSNFDKYYIAKYHDLVDAPMMYCKPDTTVLTIGGAKILFSIYSPSKLVSSRFVSQEISTVLEAAKDYLGGKLPIEKYAFIIYLFDGFSGSGSAGALEHSYSSMYFMQEEDSVSIAKSIRDVAAHEFYHIITPLNIHSEEIGNFDFANPKMSRHLWLYEGVTEYTAHFVQFRQKLLTEKEFMDEMIGKVRISRKYFNDTLPFTEMSLGCLDKYERQYQNVYEKGALIGLCLDIELRKLSKGKVGLQDIINILAVRYPKDKSFKDENLFAEFVELTYPELDGFFKNFVEGSKPLPLRDIFADIGYVFHENEFVKDFSFGSLKMVINPKNKRLIVYDIDEMDDFGKLIGFQVGDQLLSINKEKVTTENFKLVKRKWLTSVKEGDLLKVKVFRPSVKGKIRKKTLKANAFKVTLAKEDYLEKMEKPNKEQIKLLENWKSGM